ncbi:MAG: type VI secretion system baseplate subunit TssE [Aquabacterium sp.]|uniref:type VI secretion system baseplate subunit TssE n=1 Tax=Aquabacterium sp. TaxID=1872578 RepID=UPI0025C71C39|nr:type VI secretion system baseplate subunit TssE [Aquabacterium sp.]MBI3384331.1 type VI secretion system baseplate subunit TssE [Aquabacterium sp.]
MDRFEPSLLDRLIDGGATEGSAAKRWYSLEDIKSTVARDVEVLLNTRCSTMKRIAQGYPECSRSVYAFGMPDFSSMALASDKDRDLISASIESAIRCFEPRLRDPVVTLATNATHQHRLEFSISAVLVLRPFQELVSFDAALHPLTHRYVVQRSNLSGLRAR